MITDRTVHALGQFDAAVRDGFLQRQLQVGGDAFGITGGHRRIDCGDQPVAATERRKRRSLQVHAPNVAEHG